MKKNLLVTLADRNYIEQAKQLFSSAYWNAGWKGDYMLLAYKIPEKDLKWFRKKGILVKKCKLFYNKDFPAWPVTVLGKFYLFTPEFKKWKTVIFLDGDIIVRASLNRLTKIKGFAAVQDIIPRNKLYYHFPGPKERNKEVFNKLKKNYSLRARAFNSGVMAFNTSIIKKNSFLKLKKIFEKYKEICPFGEQPILNLFFYKKWTKLPRTYNVFPYLSAEGNYIEPEKIKGKILHITAHKPWNPENYFYKEWKDNLKRAEKINLKKVPRGKVLTKKESKKSSAYIKKEYRTFALDRYIGLIGEFLKKISPESYIILKNLKNRLNL